MIRNGLNVPKPACGDKKTGTKAGFFNSMGLLRGQLRTTTRVPTLT
ncbi:hypothetical protein HPDFL43_00027310 [Hoeflea phototrophica DFL-43]|jgi:hypothetical protein|uniref:Uncharacterized protein n=1 Tax=Hoeflea phototrophica (strain DSM 17068 / NCIMB 14078 / DFL-43) TaxID=411684 RepID=A0A095BE66_HOEPD|nr:hypothetical protein HPDFL43_00027310 [Hoeflea phototrophica DFL-43]